MLNGGKLSVCILSVVAPMKCLSRSFHGWLML
jgi:hypothetical protein